jgi:hypothetical protein
VLSQRSCPKAIVSSSKVNRVLVRRRGQWLAVIDRAHNRLKCSISAGTKQTVRACGREPAFAGKADNDQPLLANLDL